MRALTPRCAVNNWCVSVLLILNCSNASLPAVTTRSMHQESSEVVLSVALYQYRYSCILLVALPAHANLASSVV